MLHIKDFSVGVDCEEISRFKTNPSEKIFTKKEIEYCSKKASPEQHLAARFAAKEAIIKCLGSFGKRTQFNLIEILRCENGTPSVRILDEKLRGYDAKVSLSHSGNMAIAFAIMKQGDGRDE